MFEDFLSRPEVMAALAALGVASVEGVAGWVKNSKIPHKSIVLKILGKIGLRFADRWNAR